MEPDLNIKNFRGTLFILLFAAFFSGDLIISYTFDEELTLTEQNEKGEEKSEKEKEEKKEQKNKEEFVHQNIDQITFGHKIRQIIISGHYSIHSIYHEVITPPPEC